MGKMEKRRRKAKKAKQTESKMLELLKNSHLKIRVPVPPVGYSFKSKKDYDRKKLKQILKKEIINE